MKPKTKRMTFAKVIILSGLMLCGCEKQDYGPTLTEAAEVVDVCFVPKGHGSDTAIGFNMGKGGGITVTPIEIDIPERYAVVFKCQHGKFVIDGDRGEKLYKSLEKGDRVTVSYCQIITTFNNGETAVTGLHFQGAVKDESRTVKALLEGK